MFLFVVTIIHVQNPQVKEITRDIKQLDCAKKNLTAAITTLNHLHMLVGGVESLTKLAEKRQYGELLNPLQAITEVNQHFQQYTDIEQIKVCIRDRFAFKYMCAMYRFTFQDLSDQVEQIHKKLATQINEDFRNTFTAASPAGKISLAQLTDAALVVSVLSVKVKEDLLQWFISKSLLVHLLVC